jgi:hypothetical protein
MRLGRAAPHHGEFDRPCGTCVTAALADDALSGEACISNARYLGPGCRQRQFEHRNVASLGAVAAEGAFAILEIDFRVSPVAGNDDALRAGGCAGATPHTRIDHTAIQGIGWPDGCWFASQPPSQQAAPSKVDLILRHDI